MCDQFRSMFAYSSPARAESAQPVGCTVWFEREREMWRMFVMHFALKLLCIHSQGLHRWWRWHNDSGPCCIGLCAQYLNASQKTWTRPIRPEVRYSMIATVCGCASVSAMMRMFTSTRATTESTQIHLNMAHACIEPNETTDKNHWIRRSRRV